MIVCVSKKLANAMVLAGAAKEQDREVYEYGLEILISTAASVVCVLLAGILLGKVAETLAFLLVFIALRSVAGGFHASTHLRCFLVMMAAYTASMALVIVIPADVGRIAAFPVAALAVSVVAVLAPAPHDNRPADDQELRKFRILSLWIAGVEAVSIVFLAVVNLAPIAFAAAFGMASSSLSLVAAHRAARQRKSQY